MKNLSDLLSRIKHSLDKDTETKGLVSQFIKDRLRFDVDPQNILIKNDSLVIKTTPAKRSEIKMHEAEILNAVRNSTKLNLTRITY